MKRFFLFILLTLSVACAQPKAVISLPDQFIINARIADTDKTREHGLMFVKHLPENEGMLFYFDEEAEHVFWMKNTLIDLDIIFISADKTVSSVEHQVPHTYTYTPDSDVPRVYGYGKYVLELPAKTAAKHGITRGSRLTFDLEKHP